MQVFFACPHTSTLFSKNHFTTSTIPGVNVSHDFFLGEVGSVLWRPSGQRFGVRCCCGQRIGEERWSYGARKRLMNGNLKHTGLWRSWCLLNSLSQWLNFKLFGITHLVGKIKFKLFFSGSIGWVSKGKHNQWWSCIIYSIQTHHFLGRIHFDIIAYYSHFSKMAKGVVHLYKTFHCQSLWRNPKGSLERVYDEPMHQNRAMYHSIYTSHFPKRQASTQCL